MPWGKRAAPPAALPPGQQPALAPGQQPVIAPGDGATAVSTAEVVESAGSASFRDRGRLRRRLRFLRRARELAFRDVGGLIFDMRRFDRERPDLIEAKLAALGAVDRELRALERVLDDRRPIHELREPGLSSCPRCGALHASEDNFCPRCGLQFGGAQAMGEVGGAIAAPPQAPPPPIEQPTAATLVPGSGRDQAASQTVPAARPGLFTDAPHRGAATAADGPGLPAAGAQSRPAAPAGGSRLPAAGAQDRPATPADQSGPPADGAEDSSATPAPGDEQQTEIIRPRDAP